MHRKTMHPRDFDEIGLASMRGNQPLCGCGTCEGALKTAARIVCQELRGEDCSSWHRTVHELVLQLYSNADYARMVASEVPAPDDMKRSVAAERQEQVVISAMYILAANEKLAAHLINDKIYYAYAQEPEPVKGSESEQ